MTRLPHFLHACVGAALGTQRKPFSRRILRRCPATYPKKGPHFVGVGIPKAGTTWWHSLLLQHPHIDANRLKWNGMKETNYLSYFPFRSLTERERDVYYEAFRCPDDHLCGEWSVQYLFAPGALHRLKEVAPNTKILLLLRNPVDVFISCVNYFIQDKWHWYTAPPLESKNNWLYHYAIPLLSYYCHFANEVALLLHLFQREQICFLQFEKCTQAPQTELSRTYQFLGVDSLHVPENLTRPVNKTRTQAFFLNGQERAQLRDQLAPDVRRLQQLLPTEIDMQLWKDFCEVV